MKTSSSDGNKKMIPKSAMEAMKRTSENMEEMKAHLEEFMSYCDADTLAKMEPLERAQALFLLAKATTTLFAEETDEKLTKKRGEKQKGAVVKIPENLESFTKWFEICTP
ncbi:nuclear nucleic acid-binding protein C1D [Forsythia ovata]|uniref:Nuclear nucleic acid-binding protein C1D n=1 Tax=Forsythia ovata TaxID=205694 RepID=A0ABD1UV21_9LAMI